MPAPWILAIESSCDETAVALCHKDRIVGHIVASQHVHSAYGGVVPELASRDHQRQLLPLVRQLIQQANITPQHLHAVAFTQGPGLLGALLMGTMLAKSLAWALDIPLIAVNHMQAHLLANLLEHKDIAFPLLCLTVSGGHTQLVLAQSTHVMHVLGETQDDAAGEALDKIAGMLGLAYPGGPLLDALARQGDPYSFDLPKSHMPGLHFSFSGIKTAVRYLLQQKTSQDADFILHHQKDMCASVERTVVDMLTDKLVLALDQYPVHTLALAGGVAANTALRKAVQHIAQQRGLTCSIPSQKYCTDNAAMIACAAYHQYLHKDFAALDAVPIPRLEIPALPSH